MFRNKLIYIFIKNSGGHQYKQYSNSNQFSRASLKPPWKILFFGTDDFSLPSLKALYNEYTRESLLQKLEIVTSQKAKINVVEQFSIKKQLVIHNWPIDYQLCKEFHVGMVVSFGHLIPKNIIESFPFGMLNVHASLLPRWRGAAPVIYAIANGDECTGITIMNIKPHKFDVGDIVLQSTVQIQYNTNMPELYSILANCGAEMLIEVLQNIPGCISNARIQPKEGVTYAPKVTPEMSQINWETMSARNIYNLGRALTGLFYLQTTFNKLPVKLHNITECDTDKKLNCAKPGLIIYNKATKILKIQCVDGKFVTVEKLGVPGKKPMSASDFNNGFLTKQIGQFHLFR